MRKQPAGSVPGPCQKPCGGTRAAKGRNCARDHCNAVAVWATAPAPRNIPCPASLTNIDTALSRRRNQIKKQQRFGRRHSPSFCKTSVINPVARCNRLFNKLWASCLPNSSRVKLEEICPGKCQGPA